VAGLLSAKDRECGGNAVQHALDVDVDHLDPIVDTELVHQRDRADAGVVDQDIESTVGREGEGDEPVNLATLADVTRSVDRLAACVLDAARELREPIFAACTEDERGAGGSKAKRGGFADATARPGGSEPAQPTLQAHRRRHPR